VNEDLIIKYLLQETTANEEEQVKEWITSDPENEKEFKRFERIWSSSKQLETSRSTDADKAWDNFKTKVSGRQKIVENKVRSISRDYSWLKVAALVFIVAATWAYYSTVNNGYATLESGSLVRTETLPDGSEVTLNKNSRIAYSRKFTGDTRSVKLEKGEVFFNVTAEKSKPFIIEADEVAVRVVGTSFNVKHNEHITEVIVETGVVQVAKAGRVVELRAGERVSIGNNSAILRKEPNTDKLYKYYRSKMFVADNTPLWRVVEVLNEAYEANIIIENDQHKNLALNTTFEDESLDEIVRVITQTFKINAVKENGKIILR